MWVRSEFGVLVNLDQVSEVTLESGTVEVRMNGESRPLAHRSDETEARKVFELLAQELEAGKRYLDLNTGPRRSTTGTDTAANVPPANASAGSSA